MCFPFTYCIFLWLSVASKLFSETRNDTRCVLPEFQKYMTNLSCRSLSIGGRTLRLMCDSLGEVYIVSAVELWTASLAPTFGVPTGNTVQASDAPATIQGFSMQKQKDAPGITG